MAQTYLQLINKVLVALREDEAAGVTEPYTKLIGQFVNEAKQDVEDSSPWRCLRTEITFAATVGNTSAVLPGTTDRSYLVHTSNGCPMAFRTDADEEGFVSVVPMETLRAKRLGSNNDEPNEPNYVAFTSDGTNLVAHWWPTPDTTYNYKAIFVVPQDDLSDKDDTLTIPWRPVVLRATYLAMDERGSEFAGRLESTLARAEAALFDAILTDIGQDNYTVTAP